MPRRWMRYLPLVLAALLTLALGIATNTASSLLPSSLTSNRWLVWSVVTALGVATAATAIWQAVLPPADHHRAEASDAAGSFRAGRDLNITAGQFVAGDAETTNITIKTKDDPDLPGQRPAPR